MTMHEHDDHPTFLGVVGVEFIGSVPNSWAGPDGPAPMTPEERARFDHEDHALIYTDGTIAVTLFEHVYAMWNARTGALIHGSLWRPGDWRMTQEGIETCAAAFKEDGA